VTTGICPGHRVQSMTCSTLTPNHCPTCKVWYGANSGERFEISLPSEDDDGSAAEIATLKAELTAARETVAKLEREKAEAWEKVHEARDKADSRLADEANIDRLAAYLGAGFDEATPRVIVDEVLGRLSAALARVAAMEPVVAACIARAEANDAQEAAKSNGAFAEEFMRWCDADDELGRRVDTFRSTSKPQEPTSE
jgi:hypothetical protein